MMKQDDEDGKVIINVNGNYIKEQTNNFYNYGKTQVIHCGKAIDEEGAEAKTTGTETRPIDDGVLRDAINGVMSLVGTKRQRYFSVIKVMIWKGVVCNISAGVIKLNELYPELKLTKTDEYSINKLDVDSFRKPFDRWTPDDAPVRGSAYSIYYEIAKKMLSALENF